MKVYTLVWVIDMESHVILGSYSSRARAYTAFRRFLSDKGYGSRCMIIPCRLDAPAAWDTDTAEVWANPENQDDYSRRTKR